MRILRFPIFPACLAMTLLAGSGAVAAQVPQREFVAITGRVIDAITGEPIEGVAVVVEGLGLRFETDVNGEFSVERIAIGGYRLQLTHPAYNPAVGDFNVFRAGGFQTAMAPVIVSGSEVITGIMGVLTDRDSGSPLAGARVQLDGGQGGTLTDGRGRFMLEELAAGWHVIGFSQFGYATRSDSIEVIRGRVTNVQASLSVDPVQLAPLEVVVERREVALQKTGFYERQSEGFGEFIDREDIEFRGPAEMTDMFQGIPGVLVHADGIDKSIVLRSGRIGDLQGNYCFPRVYLDDILVHRGGEEPAGIDHLLTPGVVAGVEIYPSTAGMPAQYTSTGASCGVIVIWTRR
ncbi:MAG: carboxypeptidase-like regulatory domain-containing protein [Gemmatimonadota bacterium]|nr:carboxypeptidase-like regulatory domain-containing protein [Gemmatimonadota bacterium]MDE2986113.1 carboxypeptidase-like regulatory domain-containing protein [Gemmatimonadota bacterium]